MEYSEQVFPIDEIERAYSVSPACGDRFVTLVEDMQRELADARKSHDDLLRMQIGNDRDATARGTYAGAAVIFGFLFATVTLVLTGHDVAGTVIGSTDLVALVLAVGGRPAWLLRLGRDDKSGKPETDPVA